MRTHAPIRSFRGRPTAVSNSQTQTLCGPPSIIRRAGCAAPFKCKLTDLFKRHNLFDSNRNTLSNEDLSVFCLSAQPCSKIAYSANRGVPRAVHEADLTERCVALGYTSAEPEHSTTSPP